MTGIHRDTIMRLGIRIGQGCSRLLDKKMRGLDCKRLELDELWGYIGKHARYISESDDPTLGDVWTFCAVDSDTKLIPAYKVCSKRNRENTNAFIADLASRLKNRVQISTDAMIAYPEAIELAFGTEIEYAQIVKSYASEDGGKYNPDRKYSQPRINLLRENLVHGQARSEGNLNFLC